MLQKKRRPTVRYNGKIVDTDRCASRMWGAEKQTVYATSKKIRLDEAEETVEILDGCVLSVYRLGDFSEKMISLLDLADFMEQNGLEKKIITKSDIERLPYVGGFNVKTKTVDCFVPFDYELELVFQKKGLKTKLFKIQSNKFIRNFFLDERNEEPSPLTLLEPKAPPVENEPVTLKESSNSTEALSKPKLSKPTTPKVYVADVPPNEHVEEASSLFFSKEAIAQPKPPQPPLVAPKPPQTRPMQTKTIPRERVPEQVYKKNEEMLAKTQAVANEEFQKKIRESGPINPFLNRFLDSPSEKPVQKKKKRLIEKSESEASDSDDESEFFKNAAVFFASLTKSRQKSKKNKKNKK